MRAQATAHGSCDPTCSCEKCNAQHGGRPRLPVAKRDDPREVAADQLASAAHADVDGEAARAPSPPASTLPSDLQLDGPGSPLPEATRVRMEAWLGRDLSNVRVHTGAGAQAAAESFGADAFAVGSHIAFARGTWAPGTEEGDRLLLHELAHTLFSSGDSSQLYRRAADDDDVDDADALADDAQACWKGAGTCGLPEGGKLPCADPVSVPSNWWIGLAVGNCVGQMYRDGRSTATYTLADWYAFSGLGFLGNIYEVLPDLDRGVYEALKSLSLFGFLARVDLLDADSEEVWEVKPVRSADRGAVQLQAYIAALNHHAKASPFRKEPDRNWHEGGWQPTGVLQLNPRCVIRFAAASPGLIVYDVQCCKQKKDDESDAARLVDAARIIRQLETTLGQEAETTGKEIVAEGAEEEAGGDLAAGAGVADVVPVVAAAAISYEVAAHLLSYIAGEMYRGTRGAELLDTLHALGAELKTLSDDNDYVTALYDLYWNQTADSGDRGPEPEALIVSSDGTTPPRSIPLRVALFEAACALSDRFEEARQALIRAAKDYSAIAKRVPDEAPLDVSIDIANFDLIRQSTDPGAQDLRDVTPQLQLAVAWLEQVYVAVLSRLDDLVRDDIEEWSKNF